ncbi:hypothetical protein J26TS2_28890 [Shouchella clausii]|nr:hypothetical protein J26TS2_28890 [Shouchella clausii]
MKQRWLTATVLGIVALSGCSEKEETPSLSAEAIEVAFEMAEEQPGLENIVLEAKVTQGDEPVDDAEEVVFEVWPYDDREESDFHEASHAESGLYQTPLALEEAGIYMVQVHVTARGMHVMPTQPLFAGEISESEIEQFEEGN